MSKFWLLFHATVVITLLLSTPFAAQAQGGLPDSPKFGYGTRLDLTGLEPVASIQASSRFGLDWIAVDYDWASIWPEAGSGPNLTTLNQVMQAAQQNNLNVLISITHAPAWASTPTGPNPDLTAALVVDLAHLYPGLRAVVIFPGANTEGGWGMPPDPAAYLQLIQSAQAAILANGCNVTLVAVGLTPLEAGSSPVDMDDLAFLSALYQQGAISVMPIVSIRLPKITGDPMAQPTPGEHHVLRHFEEVRQIMLQNGHSRGLIWLTGFAWPGSEEAAWNSIESQVQWLDQAYQLLKAQLFIGAAFFCHLNPPGPSSQSSASLLRSDLSPHPALDRLGQLIQPQGISVGIQTVMTKKLNTSVDWKP